MEVANQEISAGFTGEDLDLGPLPHAHMKYPATKFCGHRSADKLLVQDGERSGKQRWLSLGRNMFTGIAESTRIAVEIKPGHLGYPWLKRFTFELSPDARTKEYLDPVQSSQFCRVTKSVWGEWMYLKQIVMPSILLGHGPAKVLMYRPFMSDLIFINYFNVAYVKLCQDES